MTAAWYNNEENDGHACMNRDYSHWDDSRDGTM